MTWHGAGWAALGLLALGVSSFLVVALLVRRAPRDPAWSDLRHRPDPLPDGSCRVCGRRALADVKATFAAECLDPACTDCGASDVCTESLSVDPEV